MTHNLTLPFKIADTHYFEKTPTFLKIFFFIQVSDVELFENIFLKKYILCYF